MSLSSGYLVRTRLQRLNTEPRRLNRGRPIFLCPQLSGGVSFGSSVDSTILRLQFKDKISIMLKHQLLLICCRLSCNQRADGPRE